MDNFNYNTEEKAKKSFFRRRNNRFRDVSSLHKTTKKNIIVYLGKYRKNLKKLGSAFLKKEKYEFRSRNFKEDFSTIGKPIHPLWIAVFLGLIYFCEFILLDDVFILMTEFMSESPTLRNILLYLFPFLLMGLYLMISVSKQNADNIDKDDDDIAPLNSNYIDPLPINKPASNSDFFLNFGKFTPVTIICLLFFQSLVSSDGMGEVISSLALSIILVALHLTAIKLFDRILLSFEYYFYEQKIEKFDDNIIELDNKREDIVRSLNEQVEILNGTIKILKELHPKICLEMLFSDEDFNMLISLKTKSVDFGTPHT